MEAQIPQLAQSDAPLQLLLFIDKRPSSSEKIRQIRQFLKESASPDTYALQVVDVSEQPHLAEYFKLVATPSLIKIHPEPRQVLAGSNLVTELANWWGRWQRSLDEPLAVARQSAQSTQSIQTAQPVPNTQTAPTALTAPEGRLPSGQIRSVVQSAELLKLSDDIFRLQREKEDLQAQLRFKDHLMAMLAHDLRNPLTAVSIALETLEMGNNPREENGGTRLNPALMAQLVKHARTQTKSIDRMITDILQVARDKSAEFSIQPEELDLATLCSEVLERLEEQFKIKFHQVVVDIPSDLPHVYADPERVQQVIINLMDNAIKYTPEHGKIHLSILHRTTQKIQVSICDDGLGIPEENQRLIFEDRFRLKRDEEKDGYGIGLGLCKRVVQAHYGQIWVDSSPNQGSCFHFTLPVYRSTPSM
ncbi:MAG: histidine kinase [Oculatellaceae cyanobacterium Prado106]|jgi:two-component system clock-associated histidine kinase SasA|nr:histidine kinase [Oculatellaceae cyanobacterium Prado106]